MTKTAIIDLVMKEVVAKKRPKELFKAVFFDISEKAKEFVSLEAEKALLKVKHAMTKDLKDKGYGVESIEIKLGYFRGHAYITSSPIQLTKVKNPQKLLDYLIENYSPKFKFKGEEKGVSTFNVR